ncbi:MAG: NUDIX hydrolase [Nitrosomonadales bacterium]
MFKPEITVANIIIKDSKYLIVEEETEYGIQLNQPAGHLEKEESLITAVIRETFEETKYIVEPLSLINIYQWVSQKGTPIIRFTFESEVLNYDENAKLDKGIIRSLWMSEKELKKNKKILRSPLILKSIEDFQSNNKYPLSILKNYE